VTDVDECEFDSINRCHANATCQNNIGNYRCSCLPGFSGDGHFECVGELVSAVRASLLTLLTYNYNGKPCTSCIAFV